MSAALGHKAQQQRGVHLHNGRGALLLAGRQLLRGDLQLRAAALARTRAVRLLPTRLPPAPLLLAMQWHIVALPTAQHDAQQGPVLNTLCL